ncbi:MAG: flagellar hook-basal body complex protein FliE [Rhodanobacter sp.]
MSQIDVNSVLSQMRQLSTQISSTSSETSFQASVAQGTDFGSLLQQSMQVVAQKQSDAQAQSSAFERGDAGADIGSTVIAGQKADLAFRGLVEVRNKLTDAYTNIMNMPV